MCGRYTLTEDAEAIAGFFEADVDGIRSSHEPRYNIAPTQDAPVVVAGEGGRRAGYLRWGLVPHWADDLSVGGRMINARSETVHRLPAFKDSFLSRRCLVPADGFYEWQDLGGRKQPHWIHRPGSPLFGFAGIWARWKDPEDRDVHTFAILTRPAPPSLVWLHDRVPVILGPANWTDWLARGTTEEALAQILSDATPPQLDSHPVTPRVNRADYDSPDCTERVEPEPPVEEAQTSLF